VLKQRGITLVESIATLGIMSAVAVGTVMMSSQYTEDTRTVGAAEHMKAIAQATQAYVRDHRGALLGQASSTTPALITTALLSSAGYLPGGFSARNVFQQNVCALVLEPSAGVLNTLLVAEGGEALDDIALAHFSSSLGAAGGGLFGSNPTMLQGAGGAWSLPVSSFHNRANASARRCDGATAGAVQITPGTPVLAHWLDASGTADPGFLSRDVVPGNPGANTMQTHIDMGGNRIANLHSVTIGSPCPVGVADGELARGPSGEVVSCVGGNWISPGRAYWGGAVASFSALPGCSAANMGETRSILNISGVAICTGLRWDSALNTSNVLALPSHLTAAGNATIAGNASVGGNLSVSGSAVISGSASVSGNVSVAGSANLYGATTTHSSLNANAGINVGSGQTINNAGRMHIEAGENLYLKPWSAGGQVIVGGGGGSGDLTATGQIMANGSQAITGRSNDWAFMARDAGGSINYAAKNSAGSMHVNDIYIRSAGKWASDLGGGYSEFYVTNGLFYWQAGTKDPLCAAGWTQVATWVDHAGDWAMDARRLRLCAR